MKPIHSIPYSVAQPLERGSNNYYSIIQGGYYQYIPRFDTCLAGILPEEILAEIDVRDIPDIIKRLSWDESNHCDQDGFNYRDELVNLENGVFNMETGELLGHDPGFRFNYVVHANYFTNKENISCPEFEQFCQTSLDGDLKKRQLLLESIGYICTDTNAGKCAFFLKGQSNSGKSVIVEFISRLFDPELVVNIPLHQLGDRFLRAELAGKKVNVSGELVGRALKDISIFKSVTGSDRIMGEFKGKEAEMKIKLTNPSHTPPTAVQRKQTVQEYMTGWLERHGEANLRPSTRASYLSCIKTHIYPCIGDVPLSQLSPAMLDDMYRQLSEKGLSPTTVKYAHRIMGVALEHARKYHYIESNPARDTLTKFGKQGKTPDPYTVEQMRTLMANVTGTPWEPIIVLGGLYGLRVSEILGLRWRNVNLEQNNFSVVEQLPYGLPRATVDLENMAPVKSGERSLPITDITRPYFMRQRDLQANQRHPTGQIYHDNDLVIAKPNGAPERREQLSINFGQLLRRFDMPHIRFHDTRHSAATNMHELTGDFFTVSQILGHSLKGAGIQLNLSSNLDSVTAQYVDVRLERKLVVLDIYHQAVLGQG